MNRTLESRMKRLEDKAPRGPSAIIIFAKWNELNEDAIKAAFVGPPPADTPIYIFTERMTGEEWSESCRRTMADPTWAESRGGCAVIAFPDMHTAKRIHVADRPVKC